MGPIAPAKTVEAEFRIRDEEDVEKMGCDAVEELKEGPLEGGPGGFGGAAAREAIKAVKSENEEIPVPKSMGFPEN